MTKIHQGAGRKKRDQPTRKRHDRLTTGLILAGIVLVGLALRVSYLREIARSPDFAYPLVDAAYHDYWARSLATGDWTIRADAAIVDDPEIRTTPYFRPPGYPFFLAAVYRAFDGSYLAPRIVQMAAGLVGAVLAYFLGKRVFGRATGLVFAALIATYWAFIFFEGELLGETLLVPLGLALVYVLCLWYERHTLVRALGSGLLFGVFAVIRPNILLLGPPLLIWCWWVQRRRDPRGAAARTWLGFTLGALAMIAPATIRNYAVAKDFVLISSNMGVNLYTGNSENSTGQYTVFPMIGTLTEQDDWDCFCYPQIVRGVEALEGRRMKHSEASSYFARKAFDYVRTHKLRALQLALTKTLLFWGPTEAPSNKDIGLQKRESATLSLLPGFPMALSLGVVGFALLCSGRRQRGQRASVAVTDRQLDLSILMLLFVVFYFFSVLPFFVVGRFRVPVIPFLLLFGAYGLSQIGHWIVVRDLGRAVPWGAAAVVAYLGASIPIIPHEYDEARPHLLRAHCYRLAGKLDLAADECREAIRLDPASEKGHRRLADLLMHRGRYTEAIEHYTQAIQLGARGFEVPCNLALAYGSLGDLDRAIEHMRQGVELEPDMAELHHRLGNLLRRNGRADEATEPLRRAVALDPNHLPAHQDLAAALLTQRRFAEAITQLRDVLARRPDGPALHNLLGIALKSTGDLDGAVSEYRRAIELKPNDYQAHNNLGNVLLAQGQIDEAIAHYRRALEIKPDHATARQALDSVLRARTEPSGPAEAERTP